MCKIRALQSKKPYIYWKSAFIAKVQNFSQFEKILRPHRNPNNSPTRPQKAQNDPQKHKKSENQKSYKMKVISHK